MVQTGTRVKETVKGEVLHEKGGLSLLAITTKTKLTPIELGTTRGLVETSPVMVGGCKLDKTGLLNCTTRKTVLPSIRTNSNERVVAMELDGMLGMGFGGGPLADEGGKLLGMVTAQVVTTELGIAIPVECVADLLRARAEAEEFASKNNGRTLRDLALERARNASVLIQQASSTTSGILIFKEKDRGIIASFADDKEPEAAVATFRGFNKHARPLPLFLLGSPHQNLMLYVVESKDLPESLLPVEASDLSGSMDVLGFPGAETPLNAATLQPRKLLRVLAAPGPLDKGDVPRVLHLLGRNKGLNRFTGGSVALDRQGNPVGMASRATIVPLQES